MKLLHAALIVLVAPTIAGAATVFDVVAVAPFFDLQTSVTDDGGSVTGFFTVEDLNGDGVIQAVDIASWSFTGAGFADPALNVAFSSDDADAEADANPDGAVDIGAGLSAGVLDFLIDGVFVGVQIDANFGRELDIFNFSQSGALFTSADLTVTPRMGPPAPIPLPGALPALAAALAALALVRRRR